MPFAPPDLAPGSTVADYRTALTAWRQLFGKAADGYGLTDEDLVSGPPNDLIDKQAYELTLDLSSSYPTGYAIAGNGQPAVILAPRNFTLKWVEWYSATGANYFTLAKEGVVVASIARVAAGYPARTTLLSPVSFREGDKIEWDVSAAYSAASVGSKFVYQNVLEPFIARLGCTPEE